MALFVNPQTGDIFVPASPLAPEGPAGGDLSGTFPNPSVVAIRGVVVSGTPSAGQVLTATSATSASWSAGASGSRTFTFFMS